MVAHELLLHIDNTYIVALDNNVVGYNQEVDNLEYDCIINILFLLK